ncbi:MAG TPA: hypothetical protein PKN57_07055 [Saprospiraceae bacterium]|nr:hypothetical protein [Saprospiraceae bacterium]MCC6689060.1 hypothetical protein [Saprospiraceae bacterium]HMV22686.1 hypothetical protein [Saprospiraceae bacterium]HMX82302.1 hypothetical protein [Saprospiraceae bacterium]HMX84982.1 hypothetical protein [Saprospiraceae bacterium]
MKIGSFIFVLSMCCLTLFACKKDESPETALNNWLYLIDNGKFEEAKKLSTENGQYLVNVISKISEEPDTSRHLFKSLSCRVIKDSAVCKFAYEEGIYDSVYLKKVNEKWLFGGNFEELDEGLDEFFDEMIEENSDSSVY